VLDRPDRPGAADPALHLVRDEEDAVARAELFEATGEVGRHRDEAALALDGLEDDAGDRLRVDVASEQLLEALKRRRRVDSPVRIRAGRTVDLRRERPEALPVDELARHRHRQERPAVERVVEDDDRRPPCRRAGDLDGVLDRLRA
jgi:hypothetical protein